MRKYLVINGVNMNMLGVREPDIYGKSTLADLEEYIRTAADKMGIETDFFQSNYEGAICDEIQSALGVYDGIVINPAAFTHYSYAIRDAIEAVGLPTVEVHLSDIHAREPFRAVSVIEPVCIAQICGMGKLGYIEAAKLLLSRAMN